MQGSREQTRREVQLGQGRWEGARYRIEVMRTQRRREEAKIETKPQMSSCAVISCSGSVVIQRISW